MSKRNEYAYFMVHNFLMAVSEAGRTEAEPAVCAARAEIYLNRAYNYRVAYEANKYWKAEEADRDLHVSKAVDKEDYDDVREVWAAGRRAFARELLRKIGLPAANVSVASAVTVRANVREGNLTFDAAEWRWLEPLLRELVDARKFATTAPRLAADVHAYLARNGKALRNVESYARFLMNNELTECLWCRGRDGVHAELCKNPVLDSSTTT